MNLILLKSARPFALWETKTETQLQDLDRAQGCGPSLMTGDLGQ